MEEKEPLRMYWAKDPYFQTWLMTEKGKECQIPTKIVCWSCVVKLVDPKGLFVVVAVTYPKKMDGQRYLMAQMRCTVCDECNWEITVRNATTGSVMEGREDIARILDDAGINRYCGG